MLLILDIEPYSENVAWTCLPVLILKLLHKYIKVKESGLGSRQLLHEQGSVMLTMICEHNLYKHFFLKQKKKSNTALVLYFYFY